MQPLVYNAVEMRYPGGWNPGYWHAGRRHQTGWQDNCYRKNELVLRPRRLKDNRQRVGEQVAWSTPQAENPEAISGQGCSFGTWRDSWVPKVETLQAMDETGTLGSVLGDMSVIQEITLRL